MRQQAQNIALSKGKLTEQMCHNIHKGIGHHIADQLSTLGK